MLMILNKYWMILKITKKYNMQQINLELLNIKLKNAS